MVTFISLSTYNCWQQTHKNRVKKKKKSPSSSTRSFKAQQSFLLLKGIRSSLCLWNSSWAAGKTSCFSLLEVPPSPSNGTEGMRGRDAQSTPRKPLQLHTWSFHPTAWIRMGYWVRGEAGEAFQGMCQAQVSAKG